VLMIAAVASAVVPSVLSPSPSGSNRSLEQIAAELHRSQVRLYMTAGILAAGACISIWHSLRPSKLNRTLRGPDGTALDRM
jgi:type II secretory pathway pseudopilin PulG